MSYSVNTTTGTTFSRHIAEATKRVWSCSVGKKNGVDFAQAIGDSISTTMLPIYLVESVRVSLSQGIPVPTGGKLRIYNRKPRRKVEKTGNE